MLEQENSSSRLERIKQIWRHPMSAGIQAGSVLLLIILGIAILLQGGPRNPVPSKIRERVSYPIYYPNQKLLPGGYTLNVESFKVAGSNQDAVLYAIDYSGGKIVISVQPKPSASEVNAFVHNYMPINHSVLTGIGTAYIGGIGSQTVASIATDKNAWIIVTAPSNMYANPSFTQVLKSFVAPR